MPEFVFYFSFHSKEVTKPRNKKKEFILNLFFFLIFPFLLLFKLWKLIASICCAKLLEKKDTKKITEDDSASANQGSEENVSKEEDIMKEEGSRLPDSNANSKENIVGGKRSHSTDSSGSNLAIKKSKHGSGDKIQAPDVKGTATDSKSKEVSKDGLNYDVIFCSLSRNFPVSYLQTKLNESIIT